MRRHPLLVVAATLSLALVTSCAGPSTGTEVRAHTDRNPADRSMIAPTALANSSLGTTLYRALATRNGNFVFSPYEVSTGLAMAGAGANGPTADQFDVVQHVTPGLDLDSGLNSISQQLVGRSGEQSNDERRGRITLELPTALWGQKETRLKEPFLDTLSRFFGTGIRLVDFRSDPEASRRAMNNWVRGQTHNTIEELVPRGTITDVTRLVITAAASLRAPWDVPFDAGRSRPTPFTLLDGQTVNPITMNAQSPDGLLYAKTDGWEAVGMPYLGRQLEMVVVAPDAGRFADVESRFDGAELQRVITLLRPTPLDLRLPRFGFTTQQNLGDALVEVGASAAFTPGEADFSGITDDEALSISSFPQQTFLSADEEGTTQGTATQVIRRRDQVSITLTPVSIARPFIVMVIDRSTGEPIFLGRVLNPTS